MKKIPKLKGKVLGMQFNSDTKVTPFYAKVCENKILKLRDILSTYAAKGNCLHTGGSDNYVWTFEQAIRELNHYINDLQKYGNIDEKTMLICNTLWSHYGK